MVPLNCISHKVAVLMGLHRNCAIYFGQGVMEQNCPRVCVKQIKKTTNLVPGMTKFQGFRFPKCFEYLAPRKIWAPGSQKIVSYKADCWQMPSDIHIAHIDAYLSKEGTKLESGFANIKNRCWRQHTAHIHDIISEIIDLLQHALYTYSLTGNYFCHAPLNFSCYLNLIQPNIPMKVCSLPRSHTTPLSSKSAVP